jgi:hypothetical protein
MSSICIWAIGLAQIGAHVGSPLRQNPKTRVLNIAIFRQKTYARKLQTQTHYLSSPFSLS